MFLRRFVWLIALGTLVLVVSACGVTPEGFSEVLTAEQITDVGCNPEESEGKLSKCVVNAIGCEPGNPEETVKACMEGKIQEFGCGPVDEKPPQEIAACMVDYFQDGEGE